MWIKASRQRIRKIIAILDKQFGFPNDDADRYAIPSVDADRNNYIQMDDLQYFRSKGKSKRNRFDSIRIPKGPRVELISDEEYREIFPDEEAG